MLPKARNQYNLAVSYQVCKHTRWSCCALSFCIPSSVHPSTHTRTILSPNLPSTHHHRHRRQSLGDTARAIQGYKAALELDEQGIPDAHFNLGVALQETGGESVG